MVKESNEKPKATKRTKQKIEQWWLKFYDLRESVNIPKRLFTSNEHRDIKALFKSSIDVIETPPLIYTNQFNMSSRMMDEIKSTFVCWRKDAGDDEEEQDQNYVQDMPEDPMMEEFQEGDNFPLDLQAAHHS